jgi:hypothetical protein
MKLCSLGYIRGNRGSPLPLSRPFFFIPLFFFSYLFEALEVHAAPFKPSAHIPICNPYYSLERLGSRMRFISIQLDVEPLSEPV